jgi:hypothetical protein
MGCSSPPSDMPLGEGEGSVLRPHGSGKIA